MRMCVCVTLIRFLMSAKVRDRMNLSGSEAYGESSSVRSTVVWEYTYFITCYNNFNILQFTSSHTLVHFYMTLAKVGSALLIQLPSMCCLNQNVRGKASILCGLTVLVFDEMKVACHLMWHSGVKHYLDLHWLQKICLPRSMSMSCCRSLKLLLKPATSCGMIWPIIIILLVHISSANSVDFKFILACVLDFDQ